MLVVALDLSRYALGAGEPFLLQVAFQDSDGNRIDPGSRAFALSVYKADRSIASQLLGQPDTDAGGPFLRFEGDGQWTEAALAAGGQNIELAERYLRGRGIIATGKLEIATSAATVPSLDGSAIGAFAIRVTIKDADAPGAPPSFAIKTVAWTPMATGPLPTVTLSSAQSKAEGNSGATVFAYTVTRSTSSGAVNVPWSFAAGSTSASDFTGGSYPAGGTVAIADGQTSGTFQISVAGDTTVEPDEQFTVSIAAPSGYAAGSSMSATGTIVNDDSAPAPTIAFANPTASATEGNSGTTTVTNTINVTRNGATGALTIALTYGGTATSGTDYVAGPTSMTIGSGQSSGSFDLQINGDTTVEPDETIVINAALQGYSATASKTITIANDDTAAPTVNRLAPAYIDTFAQPATGTAPLQGRANWTTAATNLEVTGGYVHMNQLYQGADALFGGDVGASFSATFDYSTVGDSDSGNWDQARQKYYLWYVDASNFCTAQISKSDGKLTIAVTQGGNQTASQRWNNVPFLDRGEIALFCNAGLFTAMVDGVWLPEVDGVYYWPFDKMDLSGAVPPANRKGSIGFQMTTWRYPILYGIAATPILFTITSCDDFVGRDSLTATGGTAVLSGAFPATANPQSWVARVLNATTKAVVADWATLANAQVSGQTVTGSVFLPTGGPYMIEAGYIDSSDGKARLAMSKAVWSGIRGEVWGQSNAANRGVPMDTPFAKVSAALTSAAAYDQAGPSIYAHTLNHDTYNGMAPAAAEAAALLGKPIGIGAQGVGGVGIDVLSPGGAGWSLFTGNMSARRGVVEFVIWDQGEGDADGNNPPSYYADHFRNTLLPGLRTATNNPNLIVLISPIGRYASSTEPNGYGAVKMDQQRDILRQQYLAIVAAEPNVHFADHKLGTDHASDPYHYVHTAAGYAEMARREGYSIAKYLGASIPDGTGAHVTSAARSGATIDLTLDLNGGTAISDLTASPSTGTVPSPTLQGMDGYQVSGDDFATTLAISSVARNGNGIRITLAADPGKAVKVRSFYGWSFDDTQLFYTTGYADGRTPIPVAPIMTPIATS